MIDTSNFDKKIYSKFEKNLTSLGTFFYTSPYYNDAYIEVVRKRTAGSNIFTLQAWTFQKDDDVKHLVLEEEFDKFEGDTVGLFAEKAYLKVIHKI